MHDTWCVEAPSGVYVRPFDLCCEHKLENEIAI